MVRSLYLAYIDSMSEDLAAWWPKVCPGGLLAPATTLTRAPSPAPTVRHFFLSFLLRAAPDATLIVTSDHPATWLFFRTSCSC